MGNIANDTNGRQIKIKFSFSQLCHCTTSENKGDSQEKKMPNAYSTQKENTSQLQWKPCSSLFFLTCFTGGVITVACGLRGCWLFSFCACSCSLASFCFSSSVSDAFKRESTDTKLHRTVILTLIFLFHK